jgi:DedD protein
MTGGGSHYRFELTRLEIAGVLVSSAASLFIVFLLGVYTGRGFGERELAAEERVVRLPVAPAAEATPAREVPLSFEERMASASGRGAAAPADALPAAGAERAAPSPKAAAPVAAAKGRDGEPTGLEGRPPAGDSEPKPDARSATGERGEAGGAGARATDVEEKEAPAGVPKEPPARVTVAIAAQPTAVPPAGAGPRGLWSVQVTATRDSRTADEMVRRLRAKGYEAYVVKARRQDGTFYRVRVGRFASMEQAGQMVSKLRREPGVPEAFVASD